MRQSDNPKREPLMRVPELAEYLGLAEGTIRNKVSRGEIPHVKFGVNVRFRRSEIDAWIDRQNQREG